MERLIDGSRRMKIIAFALGVSIAGAAGANDGARAELVGQRVITSYPGSPILICRYRTAQTKYEVLAASASCAPYLALEQDGNRGTFAAASAATARPTPQ
jgi:hypothetical protein